MPVGVVPGSIAAGLGGIWVANTMIIRSHRSSRRRGGRWRAVGRRHRRRWRRRRGRTVDRRLHARGGIARRPGSRDGGPSTRLHVAGIDGVAIHPHATTRARHFANRRAGTLGPLSLRFGVWSWLGALTAAAYVFYRWSETRRRAIASRRSAAQARPAHHRSPSAPRCSGPRPGDGLERLSVTPAAVPASSRRVSMAVPLSATLPRRRGPVVGAAHREIAGAFA